MVSATFQRPQLFQHGSVRSKSNAGVSFINRRFSAISVARDGETESDEDIRGPLGLNVLFEPSEPLIDFIFVHGLRGGSRKTWSKTEDPAHFWPKEWLPAETRFKNVRIHSFGYNSDWGDRKGSTVTLHDFGQALLGDIQNTLGPRTDAAETPLVLVGHSMGGIVIKKVLLLARQDPLYHRIAARIHAMFFLATPHRGADSAQLLSNMLKAAVSYGSKAYVDSLTPNSDTIQVINDGFRHVYQGVQLWSFFETVKTSLGLIVEKDSAVLDLPGERVQLLNADHRNVCKYGDPSDNNYITLRNAFVATIDSIESTWYSSKKTDHQQQMRILGTYFGLLQTPENDLDNITETQLDGSCEWLTNDPHFLAWRSGLASQPKVFWLTGEPATGKSHLAGHVIRHLEQMNGDCSYFFFKHHSSGKSTVADLLCSLAWQMASLNTDIRQSLLSMHNDEIPVDRTDERAIWRSVFLSRVFRTQLRQPHFWILDATDECTNFASFLPLLARIDAQFPLQILFTSRPSLITERALSHERISMYHEAISREHSLGDIGLYVKAHAEFLPCESQVAREHLVEQIIEKSNGNFLWASLVVRELEAAMSEQRIQEVLESVPQEIDELYDRVFRQLMASPNEARLVKTIFNWIVCASRPLTVEELKQALHLDIGEVLSQLEKTVGSICGNLVFVDLQSHIHLAHQTLKEYLCREDMHSELSVHKSEAHSRIATVCLEYLQGDEMKVPRHRRGSATIKNRKRSPFSEYVVKHFSDHVVKSASAKESLITSLAKFLQSTSLVWLELIASSQELSSLTAASRNIRLYLERRSKYEAPVSPLIQKILGWTDDLVRLVAQFGVAMILAPSAIAQLIPPICPTQSSIYQAFHDFYPRGLRLVGLSRVAWDDRLCSIDFLGVQALSLTCRDNKYALGLSNGWIKLYHEASFQEQVTFEHREPVRQLAFGTMSRFLASAGRKRITVWDTLSYSQMWSADLGALPLAIDFNDEDTVVMAATRSNTLSYWDKDTGKEIDVSQFSDINEEDQSEYHYKRSPTRVRIASSLNLLGVAYRQRPISFWDLEDNSFVGQYHKQGSVFPEPLIHDFIFNPNPDVCLAAVAYEGSDIAVFDPLTQHTVAALNVSVSSLAASPDGTILATGSGDGVIKIFEFETLRLTYQVSSYEQDVRVLAFTSNNLRLLDVRGNQLNVWEPSNLAYRPNRSDDSSMAFGTSVSEDPEYVAASMVDEDLTITALATHHDGGIIFAGRENGSIALYSTATGEKMQEICAHGLGLAIITLEWCQRGEKLLAVDRSGGYSVQQVKRDNLKGFHAHFSLKQSGEQAQQILLSPFGHRILVSTTENFKLLSLEGTLITSMDHTERQICKKWLQHPKNPEILLLIHCAYIKIFQWSDLSENAAANDDFFGSTDMAMAHLVDVLSTSRGECMCIYVSDGRNTGLMPSLRLYSSSEALEAKAIKPKTYFDDIAKDIKCVVGTFRSQMIYLNQQGWICSLNIDDVSPEKFYTRHFFIPMQWHCRSDNPTFRVTDRGSVVLAVRDEIAVFHNGLNFEERVGCKGPMVSAKASMRSVMKRGVSQP